MSDTVLLVEFTKNSHNIALVGEGWDAEMNGKPTSQRLGVDYYGLTFSGNSYLSLEPPRTLEMQHFTIEVVAESDPNSRQPYLSMGDSFWLPIVAEDGTIGFVLCMTRASNERCEEKWEVLGLHVPEGVNVFLGVHHYALTYDSTHHAVKLFVDGALVVTRKTPTDKQYLAYPQDGQPIRVGGENDDNEHITIYYVRLSNRATSAEDIITSRICKMLL